MVSVKKIGHEYSFIMQNMVSDQSKSHEMPLRGVRINLYQLGTAIKDYGALFHCNEMGGESLLDVILLSQWEDHSCKGQLNYDITTCELKIVDGRHRFTAQLNKNWNSCSLADFGKKFLPAIGPIRESYLKPLLDDILFCISIGEKEQSVFVPSSALPKEGVLVVANANPVEYGHIFLLPYDIHQMPQILGKKTFGLITVIAAEMDNSTFHIFFDHDGSKISDKSYFQASYFANPLPVELAPTIPVYGNLHTTGFFIREVAEYPLRALVFMSKSLNVMAEVVGEICSILHDNGTAFSLLICDCGTKMFLFPQVHMPLKEHYLTASECAGYLVCETKFYFDQISEEEISKHMASLSLNYDSFQALKQLCCSTANRLGV